MRLIVVTLLGPFVKIPIWRYDPLVSLPLQTSPHMCESFFPSPRKSRTVGRTRCDCFHTQEVITADLPPFWLRLINIDKQLMRCQAGTRPFPSFPPMTQRRRINDLHSAVSLSFTRAKCESLITFSGGVGLSQCSRTARAQKAEVCFIVRGCKWTLPWSSTQEGGSDHL